ncbi:ABC transporter ATP-binding protein [Streptomyces sp. NPDC057486]|uniref:ABC transporter ATP-binding protein n=1 Tax=Streptomyces sp. NPDC057486 TaxID=3346145 RepID=UPI0036A1D0C9
MPELVVSNLEKSFGGVSVLQDVNFTVKDGEFFTLLGPSGCGKSTTLSCIAGLDNPDSGRIEVGDRVFFDHTSSVALPPEQRNLGLVFQSYALWPHMTIADNLAMPLKLRKIPKSEQRRLIDDALTKVDIAHLRDRYPHQLSGGQQQRVALARGIVYAPEVLLLDEPLSNLDARMRDSARTWLKMLQQEVGVTTVYVTHDQVEAMSLSDRIAVFMNGRLQQVGTPTEIYRTPATPEVAGFIGRCNLVSGKVEEETHDGYHLRVRLKDTDQELRVKRTPNISPGQHVTIGLRSENIELSELGAHDDGTVNVLHATVTQRSYTGARYEYLLAADGLSLFAEAASCHDKPTLNAIIRPDDCLVYPAH